MHNETQMWYMGEITQFGDIQKIYDDETLWTMESKDGSYASVILDKVMVSSYRCEGAWDLARKEAEALMLKREQLLHEGWIAT